MIKCVNQEMMRRCAFVSHNFFNPRDSPCDANFLDRNE